MKIHQLLNQLDVAVTNEEHNFISKHNHPIKITSLNEHDYWLAQNLVRKGIYIVTNDDLTLIKQVNASNK